MFEIAGIAQLWGEPKWTALERSSQGTALEEHGMAPGQFLDRNEQQPERQELRTVVGTTPWETVRGQLHDHDQGRTAQRGYNGGTDQENTGVGIAHL